MLVGFESARIGILNSFDDEGIDPAKIFTVDANAGGTLGANITNLNYTPTINYASDVAYRISGKGHGAITCAFTAEDIPIDIMAQITGMIKNAQGIYTVGKDTQAPYCAIELVSHDADNNKVYLSLLKGQFGVPDRNPQTNQAQETDTTDAITFTGIDRKSDGLAFAEGHAADETFQEEQWNSFIFPASATTTTTTAPTTTTTTTA